MNRWLNQTRHRMMNRCVTYKSTRSRTTKHTARTAKITIADQKPSIPVTLAELPSDDPPSKTA